MKIAPRTTLRGLKNSIKANKSIIHPIIVKKHENGRYLVIEGNTRLMIYREFKEKNFDGDWDTIPCYVYDVIESAEIDAIRLQSHLVGPRQWSPYAKARYLAELERREDVSWDTIVSFCGEDRRSVDTLVSAFYDMENYYRVIVEEEGAPYDTSRFSTFVVFQGPNIQQAVFNNGFDQTDYARWVHTRKIFPSQDARAIPRILNNSEAREIFLNENSRAALNYLNSLRDDGPNTSLEDASIEDLSRELFNKLLNMTRRDEQALIDNPESEQAQILIQLESELDVICDKFREK